MTNVTVYIRTHSDGFIRAYSLKTGECLFFSSSFAKIHDKIRQCGFLIA